MKKITLAFTLLTLFSIPTFAQKTPKVDFAKKIREATPAELPQTPIIEKLKTDAQDQNLKGKVKSVTTDWQANPKDKRERSSEEYYNERGSLIKEVFYADGYPEHVTVWGYLEGKRVNNMDSVEYEEGERPEPEGMSFTAVGIERSTPTAPRDDRYVHSRQYKYDEKGNLVEEKIFENNGELWSRTVYSYKGNIKQTVLYDYDGKAGWRQVEVLDKNGNAVEQTHYNSAGKVSSVSTFTYQSDSQGNWIIRKEFEKKTIKGKTVLKPGATTYRTITYYP